jgi:hypothetical protein
MKNETHDLEIQVVIQFGGTKGEQYLHSFDDEVAAKKFMRSAGRAAYRCLGPFPIALPGVGDLANAAKKVASWAKRERLESKHVQELARSLATLRKEFRLR